MSPHIFAPTPLMDVTLMEFGVNFKSLLPRPPTREIADDHQVAFARLPTKGYHAAYQMNTTRGVSENLMTLEINDVQIICRVTNDELLLDSTGD